MTEEFVGTKKFATQAERDRVQLAFRTGGAHEATKTIQLCAQAYGLSRMMSYNFGMNTVTGEFLAPEGWEKPGDGTVIPPSIRKPSND